MTTNETAARGTRRRASLNAEMEAVRPRPRYDKQIWGIYFALVFVSLVELYSASSREIVAGNILSPLLRHAALLGLGFVCMLLLQRTHYRYFYRSTFIIVALSIASVFYTMKFGLNINGAKRAFSLFGLCTVQPSELIKLSAALLTARLLCNYIVRYTKGHIADEKRYNHRLVFWSAFMVLVFGGLLISQGMTNTLIMMAISISMMIIGGIRVRELLAVGLVYGCIAGMYGVYKYGGLEERFSPKTETLQQLEQGETLAREGTHVNRLKRHFRDDKFKDTITSENAQEMYGYIAQANGGVFGRFPGNSRETARLPLAFSDYIYAIIVEDMGLVGGAVVMLLYLWLLARAGRIATQCKKAYPALLVIGMAVFIVCQALVHMGIVSGFLPVSGQPLPLISKGGSSVIVTSIALGIMLSVSRFALRKGVRQEANDRISSLSDKDMADNPTQL